MDEILDTRRNENNDYRPTPVPNAAAVLVLGIISIVGCTFYGVPGLVCGIIALVLHKKDKAIYESHPERYEASFKTSRAGYICAIVGTALSGVTLLFMVIWLLAFGAMISSLGHIR